MATNKRKTRKRSKKLPAVKDLGARSANSVRGGAGETAERQGTKIIFD